MELATLLLLCWDYHRWETLFFAPHPGEPAPSAPAPRVPLSRLEVGVYAFGLLAGMNTALGTRGLSPHAGYLPSVALALAAGLAAVALGLRAARRARPGRRSVAAAPSPAG